MTVSTILGAKGSKVVTARPNDTVRSVIKTLAEKHIGAIVITDDLGRIQGIVSERDVVRVLASDGAGLLDKPVSTIMTKGVKSCALTDNEQELMSLMTANRVRHLPVVNGGKLVGMISIGDVVKHRIEAIEHEAEDLKAYISGAA